MLIEDVIGDVNYKSLYQTGGSYALLFCFLGVRTRVAPMSKVDLWWQ
jgi:hypothetical protein